MTTTTRWRGAVDEALCWSVLLVPATSRDEEGAYDLRALRHPSTDEPVLPAFTDPESFIRWEGQPTEELLVLPAATVLQLVAEQGFAALVLNPDAEGAVVLERDAVLALREAT